MSHINNKKFKTKNKVKQNTGEFIDALYKETSKGLTENMATTFIRSGSSLLDFYAQAGSMRKNPDKALDLFKKAFSEDREKAIKILFYLRDCRGGQGERDLFRKCFGWLGKKYPSIFNSLVGIVPEYGRWDDIFFDKEKCFEVIKEQLEKDKKTDSPSLLAKWLPTINASSDTTRAKARFIADKLGMSEIEYRKTVRDIRKKLRIVEQKMSAKEWKNIDYSSVPSQASRIYRNAFKRHDPEGYEKYLEKVEKGEETINTKTLYPYQIYKSAIDDYSKSVDVLWNNLPDYTQGKNALVVADVSGSMVGDPMSVSVSLALYFAEKNDNKNFKNHFITFSGDPTLQKVQGKTLLDKINSIKNARWEMNTNIQAVFDLILNTGLDNNISQEEMPDTIYIISDAEFDRCVTGVTNFEMIEEKYNQAGYDLPNLVFWNVDARSGRNLPVTENEQGVSMVSGFSPVIFKIAVEEKTPKEVMLDTINKKRYNKVEEKLN